MSILPRNVNYYYDNLIEDKNLSSTNILSEQQSKINNIDSDYDLFFYIYQTDLQNTINKNSQNDLSNINKVNSLAS